MEQKKLLFEEENYKIIGVCMKVHRNLGTGFLESVYQEAIEKELSKELIDFGRQVKLQLFYDGQPMRKYFLPILFVSIRFYWKLKLLLFLIKRRKLKL